MTCEECRERLVERVEGLLEADVQALVAAHLDGCEACRREAAMIGALRERLVRAGGMHRAAAGDFAEGVMKRVAGADVEGRNHGYQIKNWLTNRTVVRRSAVAAAIAVVAGVALMMLVWGNGARPAFADVVAQVRKARAVRCHFVVEMDGPGGAAVDKAKRVVESEVLMAPPGWMVITTNGVKAIVNVQKGKMVTLIERDRRAMVTDLKNVPAAAAQGNLLEVFKKVEGAPSKALDDREIEGHKTTGFEVNRGGMQMKVWADVKTDLPVWVELTGTNPTMPNVKSTFSRFDWDPTVDASELSVEVPAGYQLIGAPDATAPGTEGATTRRP